MSSKCYRSDLVGLLGNPVDENPTIVTIEAGFRAIGLNARYIPVQVSTERLGDAVEALKALSFLGTHITIPHKVAVLKHLDHIAADAEVIGAVNTIYIKDGETYGENTDGKGFITALQVGGEMLSGAKVTVLGAGGAARAVCVELANAGAAEITVVNRSRGRGEELVALLNDRTSVKAKYVPWDRPYCIAEDTQFLVQTTSIGLYPNKSCPAVDFFTLRPETVVCDIVPNPPETAFVKQSRRCGCRVYTGLDMLVYQSAISFKLWTGLEAPLEVMKQATLREFANV